MSNVSYETRITQKLHALSELPIASLKHQFIYYIKSIFSCRHSHNAYRDEKRIFHKLNQSRRTLDCYSVFEETAIIPGVII